MKILVTGATGGLGSLIVEQLLARGHQVIATSRNAEKAETCGFYSRVTYKAYDIDSGNTDNLFNYFERPDALLHLAWEKLNEYKNEEHLSRILPKHKQFIDALINQGLRDITCVGTCYEYGLQEGELEETLPSAPTMPYPQAKDQLRQYLEAASKTQGFSFKWVRVFYVFGEIKERKNLYTLLLAAIKNGDAEFNMSGGEQVRDFLSPAQIAGIITDISLQKSTTGIINCCSGKPVKLRHYIEEFLSTNHYKIHLNLGVYPYPDYEPMNTWGSVKKLNSIYQTV